MITIQSLPILPKRGNEYPRHYNAKRRIYKILRELGVQNLQSEEEQFSYQVSGPQYRGVGYFYPDITCFWSIFNKKLAFEIDDFKHNPIKDRVRDTILREKYLLYTIRINPKETRAFEADRELFIAEVRYQLDEATKK